MSDGGCRFEVNDEECKRVIDETIIAWLYETAGEIAAEAARTSPVGKVAGGQLKNSWDYKVVEDELCAYVGSPLERAIWSEYGTGEFSAEGNGRKGGWWIPVGSGENEMRPEVAAAYSWPKVRKKAGQIVAVFTYGSRPNRTLLKAFTKYKVKAPKALARNLNAARTQWKPNRVIGQKDLGNLGSFIKSNTGKW